MKKETIVWIASFFLIALLALGIYFAFGFAEINWWGVGSVTVLTAIICATMLYLLYRRPR